MRNNTMDNDQYQYSVISGLAKRKIELVVMLLLIAAVYFLSYRYDLLEKIVYFANRHESWELDEIITVLIFLVFALLFFSMRRLRDISLSETTLKLKNRELEAAFNEIRQLRGIIPICASCKKIRDDKGFWHQVEVYVSEHSEAKFSHGICPDCVKKLYPELAKG